MIKLNYLRVIVVDAFQLPQSNPDGEKVVIGLKCRKCEATKTIERSTTFERMEQVVVSYIDRQARR